MLVWIVCPTCRMSLGDLAPIYRLIRQKRMLKRYGGEKGSAPVAPAVASQDATHRDNTMQDVLDALGIHDCCRMRLVTPMDFRTYY